MHGYIAIALELFTFAAILWFINREKKPFRVKSDMWGRYSNNEPAHQLVEVKVRRSPRN